MYIRRERVNPFMHNDGKWLNILKTSCSVNTTIFKKYFGHFSTFCKKGLTLMEMSFSELIFCKCLLWQKESARYVSKQITSPKNRKLSYKIRWVSPFLLYLWVSGMLLHLNSVKVNPSRQLYVQN